MTQISVSREIMRLCISARVIVNGNVGYHIRTLDFTAEHLELIYQGLYA